LLEGKGNFVLTKPAFAQGVQSSFLEGEAGLAAYVNVGQIINLNNAKRAFRTIEKQTDDYIIGSVALPDYPVSDDVHVYIQRDGWIVTYYMKDEPASKIIDWYGYSTEKMPTKLEFASETIASSLGMASPSLKYYHFQYTYANRLMIITKVNQEEQASFSLTLPSEITVYERSWSTCVDSDGFGVQLEVNYGQLSTAQLRNDIRHSITIENLRYTYGYPDFYFKIDDNTITELLNAGTGGYGSSIKKSYVAILLIYRE
jgi:hypothetical protein